MLACRVLKEAFYLARTGRPGPVLVDVPKDIQQQLAVPDWSIPMAISGYMSRLPQPPQEQELKRVVEALHGVSSTAKELLPALPPCALVHACSAAVSHLGLLVVLTKTSSQWEMLMNRCPADYGGVLHVFVAICKLRFP